MVKAASKYIWVVYHIGTGDTFFYGRRPLKQDLKVLLVKEHFDPLQEGESLDDIFAVTRERLR